jgi:hypothetical protein
MCTHNTHIDKHREALSFLGRLVVIPLVTGAVISRAIADPVLSFSLQVGCALCRTCCVLCGLALLLQYLP